MSLKKTLLSGFIYTGLAKYSGIVVGLIVSAILARLIGPSDFGIIAIATVFINFFSTLTTVGIAPAIVQNKTIDENDLRSINAFAVYLSIILAILFIGVSPLICHFYPNSDGLFNVLLILSISIIFSVAAIVPNAVIMKNKKFKFIAIRTFLIQIVMGFVSIIVALMGGGIYALLINPVFGSIALAFVNFKTAPIGFSSIPQKESISKVLSFSIYQMLFNLVYLLYRNIDKLVIGRCFGMEQLGYYEKSYRLMLMPLDNVSAVISPVLHPVLSDYQNDMEYLWNNYLRILRLLSEIGFFATTMAYFCSEFVITLLFGNQWTNSIPIFKILSLSIGFQIMQAPIGAFLQAINKVKSLLYSSLFVLLFVIISITVGLFFNDIYVFCIALSISFAVTFVIYQLYLVRYYDHSIGELLKVILIPFIVNVLFFAVCSFVISIYGFPNDLKSICLFVCFAFTYQLIAIKTGLLKETKYLIFKNNSEV